MVKWNTVRVYDFLIDKGVVIGFEISWRRDDVRVTSATLYLLEVSAAEVRDRFLD